MSHLNILTISREIETIKKNINLQQDSINAQRESISTHQDSINQSKNIQKEFSGCIQDLNDIKANKIDISIALDEVKNDFKFLDNKLKMINPILCFYELSAYCQTLGIFYLYVLFTSN